MKTETFEKYLKAERNAFCLDVGMQEWNTSMRTTAENLLIAYDQVCDKYLELQSSLLLREEEIVKMQADSLEMQDEIRSLETMNKAIVKTIEHEAQAFAEWIAEKDYTIIADNKWLKYSVNYSSSELYTIYLKTK